MYVLGDPAGITLVISFPSFWVWISLTTYMWILIVSDLTREVKCMYSCDRTKAASNGWMRITSTSSGVHLTFYYARAMMIWKEWVVLQFSLSSSGFYFVVTRLKVNPFWSLDLFVPAIVWIFLPCMYKLNFKIIDSRVAKVVGSLEHILEIRNLEGNVKTSIWL